MIDTTFASAFIVDTPNISPKDVKRSECVFTKIICSEGGFAAGELANGKFAAIWPGHADVVDTKDELLGILNVHERNLLAFAIKS